MTMQDVLKDVVRDAIAPLLKREGFKKKGNNFAKEMAGFWWVINIQSSKWNTKEEVEFRVNTGIFSEVLFGPYYLYDPPKFPTEVYAMLRIDTTELKQTGNGWYKICSETDVEGLKRELERDFAEIYLPHLRRIQTIADLIRVLEERERQGLFENPHHLTILYRSVGRHEDARVRMEKVIRESLYEGQKRASRELGERLGLWGEQSLCDDASLER